MDKKGGSTGQTFVLILKPVPSLRADYVATVATDEWKRSSNVVCSLLLIRLKAHLQIGKIRCKTIP